jgi:WD40 repeat protein
MTPPWPNKAFNFGRQDKVSYVAFSPSGSQLAFCIKNYNLHTSTIHVWDRWGKETLLGGHTEYVNCIEYSLDGEHLASGSADGMIRIWHAESFHSTSSNQGSERGTRTPKQADKILGGSLCTFSLCFSRTDSNLLASGDYNGEIKVWNIKEQICIHTLDPRRGTIYSLFFAGGTDIACLARAGTSVIRLWKPEGSADFASGIIGNIDVSAEEYTDHSAFFPSGSFLATIKCPQTRTASTATLYEIDTTTTTEIRSVVMPGVPFTATCFAVAPDSKQIAVGGHEGRIRLLQTDDFSDQRDLDPRGVEERLISSVAFDPTCRVLASTCLGGRLELRTL